MGELSTVQTLESYEPFFARSESEPCNPSLQAADLGHICVDSRGLVDVPEFNIQTPGDIRSIAIATQASLKESDNLDPNEVTRAVAEHLHWFGHNGCKFRKLTADIITPIVAGDEKVRADSFKIGMGLVDDDLFEQIQQPLRVFVKQPERTQWQNIEDKAKFVELDNADNKATLYIANGIAGEYFQSADAYQADRSAFVQTSGVEIFRLGERLQTAFPINIETFVATLAIIGASTAQALGAEVLVREKPFSVAA